MVEQDFARQEREKFHEARTRYIQIRLSEVATTTAEEGAVGAPETTSTSTGAAEGNEEPSVGDSLPEDELQDSVFYSTSPCHVFRETTV